MNLSRFFSTVALLVVGATAITVARAEPFTLHDKPWRGIPMAPAKVTEHLRDGGAPFTLRWDAGKPGSNNIFFNFSSRDFSGFDTLSFWLYSEKATYATIQVVFKSPTDGDGDVFETDFTVDTEGKWTKYSLELDRFKRSRSPAGWDQITGFSFMTFRHGNQPVEGTVLYFSDMALELSK